MVSTARSNRVCSPNEAPMLAERSTSIKMTSGLPDIMPFTQPPASGRLKAKISANTASIRKSNTSHWRTLAYFVDLRLAMRRNIMAAQGSLRWRKRLNRWIRIGSRPSNKPQSMKGCRNVTPDLSPIVRVQSKSPR